jgi:hypothetical protein
VIVLLALLVKAHLARQANLHLTQVHKVLHTARLVRRAKVRQMVAVQLPRLAKVLQTQKLPVTVGLVHQVIVHLALENLA